MAVILGSDCFIGGQNVNEVVKKLATFLRLLKIYGQSDDYSCNM